MNRFHFGDGESCLNVDVEQAPSFESDRFIREAEQGSDLVPKGVVE